ncbi:ribonuclease P protein component [Parapedobacter lycopersici]|uniref:ribonuclease P protein component n=1 Tax=Parapedobacter lycopersici TaxID=1864939 RepID=UPI00214DE236|nr:ribonuclease P protein component [Parapedobacter lycopersici]
MRKHTFTKGERLCSKRLIDSLFHDGSSFFIYPYRVTFRPADKQEYPVQVLFTVPKRRFRHAVQRNVLKRRMREAYRIQKPELLYPHIESLPFTLTLAIQYAANELLDYPLLFARMTDVLRRLQHESAQIHMGETH